MLRKAIPFFSSGLRVDADLYLPTPPGATPASVVVACSGFQGLKTIHPERFARALVPRGIAVVAFDYRGFGASEGERGRLVPQEQAEDVRAAVDRLMGLPEIDTGRIALLGWGLGGGVVVAAAAEDPRVAAVVVVNGVGDCFRSIHNAHDEQSWRNLVSHVEADRPVRAKMGRSEVTSPWNIVRLDLDPATDVYVAEELYRAPGFGSGVTWESADYLLRFRPEAVVHQISPRPLLVVHGSDNRLHLLEEAEHLVAAAGEPKSLVVLEGAGHTEWMFDAHPTFQHLIEVVGSFLSDTLTSGSDGRAGDDPSRTGDIPRADDWPTSSGTAASAI
jgi:pimeloyl-ACP methyl ester carboxylesterase